jgi:hypothetical protein
MQKTGAWVVYHADAYMPASDLERYPNIGNGTRANEG